MSLLFESNLIHLTNVSIYHSAPIIKLWFIWLLFNIRAISSMDIAMQLSFLLHPQWWHYVTTLRYNGIVISEDERGESSLLRLSIWSLISRPWEWAIVERNLYLGTNLLRALCAIPKFRNVRCYLRRKYGGLNVGTYYNITSCNSEKLNNVINMFLFYQSQ